MTANGKEPFIAGVIRILVGAIFAYLLMYVLISIFGK